jgi:CheY-like chemotaxis protein
MTQVLVVEDSADQALLISGLLEEAGFAVEVASDGAEALAAIHESAPDLVVTDLVMPEVDGLRLVEVIVEQHAGVPVVLVTAYGSGEVAVRALKKGAASYVPKRRLVEDLVSTVRDVLSVARERREQVRLLDFLDESRFHFTLDNDQDIISGLVSFLQDNLRAQYPSCNENQCLQIGMAVREAVRNAMHHGNLEVDSALRRESSHSYDAKVLERLHDPDFRARRVSVTATFKSDSFRCTIEDQGTGFDPALVPDPTDAENLMRTSGRGLYLIRTFMDEVTWNEVGNRISMLKRMAGRDVQGGTS